MLCFELVCVVQFVLIACCLLCIDVHVYVLCFPRDVMLCDMLCICCDCDMRVGDVAVFGVAGSLFPVA